MKPVTKQSAVDQFLAQKSLALAGASRSGKKFGNAVLKELTAKGYDVFLLHPEAPEIGDHKCYAAIHDLPREVGGLVLVVPPAQSEALVKQAAASGIKNIWMQQGSESPEAVAFCRENGFNAVHGECILMFAKPAGIHKFHRWLWGVLGKLPK